MENEQGFTPLEIDRAQYGFLFALGKQREIDVANDKELDKYVTENGYNSVNEFITKLEKSGIIKVVNNKVSFNTKKFDLVFMNGKCYGGENVNGKLSQWAIEEQSKTNK